MQEERVINEKNLMRFTAWTTPMVSNKIYYRDDILDIKDDYRILEMMLIDLGGLLRNAEGQEGRLWKIACGCGKGVYWTIRDRRELELRPISKSRAVQKNQERYEKMVDNNSRYYDLEPPRNYDSYIPEGPVDVWAVLQELFELTDPSDVLQTCSLLCILQAAGEIFCRNGKNPRWEKILDYLILHLHEVLAQRQEYIPVPGNREETENRRRKLQCKITAAAEETARS